MPSLKAHWNTVYKTKTDNQLGWYEAHPNKTMQLVNYCQLPKSASILNVGAGTTTLIDALLEDGYHNLIANDISDVALAQLQERVKHTFDYDLSVLAADITQPKQLDTLKNVDLWIDRAVLHFFLSEESITAYFNSIQSLVTKNGYVLLAVFATNGAKMCAGLPLQRYSVPMLQQRLGNNFKLVKSFNHTYINPFGGERPYIYTLFKRVS